MNNNRYYVPDIEDFRIGYELESNIKYFVGEEIWEPTILKGVDQAVIQYHKIGMYRTPYLTQEQIEAEGWEITFYKDNEKPHFIKKDIECFIHENNFITIVSKDYNFLYKGECKSINEFRYICKLLKI